MYFLIIGYIAAKVNTKIKMFTLYLTNALLEYYSCFMKILIVCSSNICRSPFAEFYLRRLVNADNNLRKKIEWIKSGAVFNKSKQIFKKAVISMRKEGFCEEEIKSHKPSFFWLDKQRFRDADIIICMSKFHRYLLPIKYRKKTFTLSEVAINKYVKIPDPFLLKTQEEYNKAMEPIKNYIDIYFEKLKKELS